MDTITTVIREGFVAAYDNRDGTIGFLATDDGPMGSGHAAFSNKPDSNHIHKDITKAIANVEAIGGMTSYHGNAIIKFETTRVVRYTEQAVIEEVENDVELYKNQLVENAKGKLTDEELEALGLTEKG